MVFKTTSKRLTQLIGGAAVTGCSMIYFLRPSGNPLENSKFSAKMASQFATPQQLTVQCATTSGIKVESSVDPKTGEEVEIHTLTPPQLDDHNIAGNIPCVRPVRRAGLRLDIERVPTHDENGKQQHRTVIHNYGFGGSGWSSCVGTVYHQLSHFDELKVPTSEPIAIIGSGVIGLFTSHFLLQRGYRDITVYTNEERDITSYRAGGVVDIGAHGNGVCLKDVELFNKAGVNTWSFFEKVWRGEVPGFEQSAVSSIPRYVGSREYITDIEFYTQHNLMGPPKDVLVKFREHGPLHNMCVVQGSLFLNVVKVMNNLRDAVFTEGTLYHGNERDAREMLKAKKNICTVTGVDDVTNVPISTKYLFNCSGQGFDDKEIERVGVYSIELKNQEFPKGVSKPDYQLILCAGEDYYVDSMNNRVAPPTHSSEDDLHHCEETGDRLIVGKHQLRTSISEEQLHHCPESGDRVVIAENQFAVSSEQDHHCEESGDRIVVAKGDTIPTQRKVSPLLYFVPKQGVGLLGGYGIEGLEPSETFPPEPFERVLDECRELFHGYKSNPWIKQE